MFRDRRDAGMQLAERLRGYKDRDDVLILALPRGGVVTGYEIARSLNAPLDVLIVRKIGFPGQPEFAIGAISETGTIFLNERIISTYGVSNEYVESEISRQEKEISRRVKLYRQEKSIRELEGKIIILVDDGVATGATTKAAIETLKKEKIKELVVAIPVSPPQTADELKKMADEFVCIETPYDFMAVGAHYLDFTQVSDEEVIDLLKKSAALEEKSQQRRID
ncbi:MAG: phosphoribosyltransferase [Nitrospirota bacterium]